MSADEYNLKESAKAIGQLRPAILAKDGWVVDGLHRLRADPKWKTERHEEIDTEEKKWIARAHTNLARRTVGREEKREIINNLAKIYEAQGLSIARETQMPTPKGVGTRIVYKNEIREAVISALRGAIGTKLISQLMDPKYVQQIPSLRGREAAEKKRQETPAIERIKRDKKALDSRYGEGFVEKLVQEVEEVQEEKIEEVREELKHDTGFRDDVKKEVEQDLRTDPDFLVEVAQTVDEVIPTLRKKPVDVEGYHVPTLTEDQRTELSEAMQRSDEKRRERAKDAWVQERGKWWRAMEAMMSISANVEDAHCPICGEPGATHLRFTCHPEHDLTAVLGLIRHKLNTELADEEAWKAKHLEAFDE